MPPEGPPGTDAFRETMPPEGPPGTDAFREKIWCSLQAAQKEGSGQEAARFLIVSILKSRIPRALISPRDPVSYLRRAAWSAILRPGRPPEPAASHKRQDPGEGGDALRRPWCHSAVQIKEIREDPGIPSSRFPVIPRMCCPLLRSCIRRRISEPDPGSRFFSFVRYVMCGRSRVLHLRYFLRGP